MMRFGMLGPVMAETEAGPVALGPPKRRLLLAVLLCSAGRAVSLDTLVEALWGDAVPASAVDNVYLHISQLRQALGSDAILGRGRSGYTLIAQPSDIDAHRFAELAHLGARTFAAGDAAAASRKLREALALWRGSVFGDLADEPYLRQEAARLEELRLTALEDRIDAELALGLHDEVVAELFTLTRTHPYRERYVGQLMLAMHRSGRQTEALQVFRDTRAVLDEQLGVEPDPALQRLHEAILRGEEPGSAITMTAAPSSGSTDSGVNMIPRASAGFVGRDSELDTLTALSSLRQDGVVIATITGTAGVGKTALAVQWGHRAASQFPDGQLYVNLRGYSPGDPVRPIEALATLLHAIGVPPEQVPLQEELAAGVFRSALTGKRVLVVLDNAATADQARLLLPATAGSMVLVTSRDSLTGLTAIEGARRISLTRLTPADSLLLLRQMLGDRRVLADLEAAAELATLCAHLPLALRIAAAQLTDRFDQRITEHVEELHRAFRLDLLQIPQDEASAVRAAFDRSYSRLAPATARLFRLLGLTPGPDVTAEAAAALSESSAWHASELLDQLAATHLVERVGPGRYGLHDLLREYTLARCATQETDAEARAARRRLYDFYLSRCDAAALLAFPSALHLPDHQPQAAPGCFDDRAAALDWLDAERAVLVRAVADAAGHGMPELGWYLADTLRYYFWIRRATVEWQATESIVFTTAANADHPWAQAVAKYGLGMASINFARYEEAIRYLNDAAQISHATGWQEAEASIAHGLGVAHSELGQLSAAAEHNRQALTLNERLGRVVSQANNLGNLGLLELRMGQFDQAAQHLSHSLKLHRDNGGSQYDGVYLHGLGQANRQLGHLGNALAQLTESLTICRELGEIEQEAIVLSELALLHLDSDDLDKATFHAEHAVRLCQHTDDADVKGVALIARASIRLATATPGEAIADNEEALQLATANHNAYVTVLALIELATAFSRINDTAQAQAHAHRATALAAQSGFCHLEDRADALIASPG